MKWAFALTALILMCASAASAGSIELSVLNEADFARWRCGEEVKGVPVDRSRDYSCAQAGFDECSTCLTLLITNASQSPIKATIRFYGRGFTEIDESGAPFLSFGGDCRDRGIGNNCNAIAPGGSCYVDIQVCPEQSGISRGRAVVTGTSAGASDTASFHLAVTTIYPPELEAAERVRKRHLAELMKISHVVRVALDRSNGAVMIDVETKDSSDIAAVQRLVPPKLDGYDVEVTEFIETGVGL